MEYVLTPNPSSPAWAHLGSGHRDLPFFAKWMHERPRRMTLGPEAADLGSAWLSKYVDWPPEKLPLHLRPMTLEDSPYIVGEPNLWEGAGQHG
jgi:hypothetical protein